MTHFVEAKGLDVFEALVQRLGDSVVPAAAASINETTAYARNLGARNIRRKYNFKAGYLGGRLAISKRAKTNDLEGVVTGLDRPTSLARFAQGTPKFGKQRTPPKVRVRTAGSAAPIRKGFFMRLRRGNSVISNENANVGLAVRLAEGERVSNKNQMVPIGGDVYLLYGPSVGQIYRTEAERNADEVGAQLAARFAHNVQRAL